MSAPSIKERSSVEKKDDSLDVRQEVQQIDDVHDINVKLANPLAGIPHEQLIADAEEFAISHDLAHLVEEFKKGALVAQDPINFENMPLLTEDDKGVLRRELTNRWNQPAMLYYLVILCSVAACVQGMDESVISGANLFFPTQFGLDQTIGRNQWILGLINGAPYLCASFIGCWITDPLNRYFAVTNSWPHLFVARFVLGLGIGPKSATVPVYAAECAPAPIRGALVMMWQMWTAFGIMLGYAADLAFYKVPNRPHITGLNWRLMLGSAGLPAFALMAQVFFCPESPRWLMSKGRYDKAFESLVRLRHSPLQAARDLYLFPDIHVLLETERELTQNRNRFLELFTVPRNRRATLAALIVMFMQQFCGVNVIAYYASSIFTQANFTEIQALLSSWGFGLVNWVFAFPAVWTIDTFGRRNLLLTTFPLMAIFLLLTGFAFWIPEDSKARIGVVSLGVYLFGVAYSPGEGPVPFTYSAEAFPLYIREIGMSLATAWLWFFNFIVAITFPRLLGAFTPQGAFGWYAAWNIVGFIIILLFVPETKALSLEELDQVFSVPTHTHAAYQLKALPHNIKKYFFRMKVDPLPPLYQHEGVIGEKHYAPGGVGAA
ncbi:hypothetical protein EVG20_g5772 [Dentipellis fragilis]|uniref:Major facilitator superfamily (MFS) profile domain-containing protein n=1 Tax=Dentipellis fragilis TaxID=205917 RepID=A0A4Y9YT49_9AGAM|nr:hypothetical protein EVG20_g5772 [Dentipellis fragilis]